MTTETSPSVTPNTVSASVEWSALHACLRAALLVASKDTCRVALNSVLLEYDGKKLRVVATDGHRLVLIDQALSIGCDSGAEPFRVVIRRSSIESVVKIKPIKAAIVPPAELVKDENGWAFKAPGCELRLDTVDEDDFHYPPYEHLLVAKDENSEGNQVVGISGDYLEDIGKIAKLLTNDRGRSVRIQVGADALAPVRCDMYNPDTGTETILIQMPIRL